jgi:hypothetical protein
MPTRARSCSPIILGLVGTCRQNVGRIAESENECAGAHDKKAPDAGKLLEAATGVEPVMEVLQTSDGRAGAWPPVREGAAQSKVLSRSDDLGC